MIDVLGQEVSGRYVIVQMDNGGDPLNLQEVKAFGRVASNTLQLATLREDINEEKNVFFWALPESHNPPPPDPNSGNLVLFFRTSKTTF